MILLGIALILVGVLVGVPPLYTVGVFLLILGVILLVLGSIGRPVVGRRHWF